ncbi:hypothetical protein [Roseobacter weihaiensis]|uniref:hypothetical protein n=1 Tax=Roseobacter weihaiensis TaxID=2763262 RepID=UPI001D09E959|nr:hypothetical protein [Roseobacter sp. H9]
MTAMMAGSTRILSSLQVRLSPPHCGCLSFVSAISFTGSTSVGKSQHQVHGFDLVSVSFPLKCAIKDFASERAPIKFATGFPQ